MVDDNGLSFWKLVSAFVLGSVLLGVVIPSQGALATGLYTYVKGPYGGQEGQNGWYLYYDEMPKIDILSGPDSNCGGSGTWSQPLNLGGGDSLGSHTLRFFYAPDDSKANLWVSRDGDLLGTMCNQDKTYVGTTVTVWEGLIKFDAAPPFVEIDRSLNNTNTKKEILTITGTAFDTDTNDNYPIGSPGKQKCFSTDRCSVLASVTVNGILAKISGETFSANLPISKGLSTVTATAIDNAGQSRVSDPITIFRSDEVEDPEESGNDDVNIGGGSTEDLPESNKLEEGNDEPVPIPVNAAAAAGAAGAAGLGVASVGGYIPYKKIGEFLSKIISKTIS